MLLSLIIFDDVNQQKANNNISTTTTTTRANQLQRTCMAAKQSIIIDDISIDSICYVHLYGILHGEHSPLIHKIVSA